MRKRGSLTDRRPSSEARKQMFESATPAGMDDLSVSKHALDIISIPCDRLVSHPLNRLSRENMSEESIIELAEIIKRDGEQTSPCVVRPITVKGQEKLQVIIGHRRWKALSHLKLEVRVIVREMDDKQAIRILNDDNRAAHGFTFYDLALEAKELSKTYSKTDVADLLGYSQQYVSNIMYIFKLPDSVREELVKTEHLQVRHVKAVRKFIKAGKLDEAMDIIHEIQSGATGAHIERTANDKPSTQQSDAKAANHEKSTAEESPSKPTVAKAAAPKRDILVRIADQPLVKVMRGKESITLEIEGPEDILAQIEGSVFDAFDKGRGLIELWVKNRAKKK